MAVSSISHSATAAQQRQFRTAIRALRKSYATVCMTASAMQTHEAWTLDALKAEAEANCISLRTFKTYAFVGRHIDPSLWQEFPQLFYTYFRLAASAPGWFNADQPEAQPRYWLQYATEHRCSTDTLWSTMRIRRDGLPEPGHIPSTPEQRDAVRRRATQRAEHALRQMQRQATRLNTHHAPYLGLQVTVVSTPYVPTPSTHPAFSPSVEV
jgi:hypothetical protein